MYSFLSFPFSTGSPHPLGLHCTTSKMDDEKYQLIANKFSGKQTDFVMWAARFISYAHSNGFDDILHGYQNMKNWKRNKILPSL
jgi:hypothetical protein